jgi:isoquinoline 1-oxidoreductase subunit beta
MSFLTTIIGSVVAGTDPKNIAMHQHFLGGGFGRRLESDMVVPAIAACAPASRPCRTRSSREWMA